MTKDTARETGRETARLTGRETGRRDELADAATDYVLEHGLMGLSLRPLAAELGTSDRMLLYHFAGKDDLVATVLRVSNDRSVALIGEMPVQRDVRSAVCAFWQELTRPPLADCQRMYIQAAALGLLGREPYLSVVREANELWVRALAEHMVASGVPRDRARRAVVLMDAAFLGLMLDMPVDEGTFGLDEAVFDVADAVVAVAGTGGAQGSA